jgi:hypothetical protein
MSNQREIFNKNIEQVLIIDSIFKYMESQVTAFDISELLRAEFVLIVSALDYYIHGVVRDGLIDQLNSTDNCNANNLCIPFSTVKVLLHINSKEEQKRVLNEQIKNITSKDSYQAPRAIEKALSMIDVKKVWTKISDFSGKSAVDIRDTLSIVINRRNKIAHEADIDFLTGEKTIITPSDIKECLEFVTEFIDAIEQITKKT